MQAPSFLYDYALCFVGTNYRWGGSNPISGFDCSGFAQELLAAVGVDIPGDQTAQALYDHFSLHGVGSIKGLGCLCFYGNDVASITHVTVGIDSHFCIGANGGGSKTVNLDEANKSDAFIKIRPINYRKDLVATLMPNYS